MALETFVPSLIDDMSTQATASPPSCSCSKESEELDEIPTKYVASEMDIFIAEHEMISSSDNWEINLTSCNTEFVYSDLDTLENELGEIYGFYELTSLSYNFEMFHTYMEIKNMKSWPTCKLSDKYNFLDDLLDDLELVDEYKRYDAILAISYMIQGCWKDLETPVEQFKSIEENAVLLLQCNGFWRIWNLLLCVMPKVEGELIQWAWGINEKIMENCLNILCTITHIALKKRDVSVVQALLFEIKTPEGDSVLLTVLESFVKDVVELTSRSFLLKKLLLFARNLILLSAGDSEDLRKMKDECRKAAGLRSSKDDTILNCRKIDVLQKNSGWNDLKDVNMMTVEEWDERTRQADEAERMFSATGNSSKPLPWSSKSSIEVLGSGMTDNHLYKIQPRLKIPHLHIPLSTFHLQEEELIRKYPKTFADQEKPCVERTEQMFQALLPVFDTLFETMMMVLTHATPVSNPSQMNLRSLKENPPFIPRYGGDVMYFVEDSKRQGEIIVKAISSILILLLKHTKLNHIYQFEYVASEITAATFLPTALRFFNRDVNKHLVQRPFFQHPHCPFKAIRVDLCLHQSGIDAMANSLSITECFGLSWRNTFSHINLLRTVNKVVKGKPSRILMLRMFKAHHCLKRCLNVKDSLFQQYTLKLLKMLCKFMDQEWKRNNQRIISAIYHKVRHRLLEDWIGEISSSNKTRKRPDKPKMKKWPWDYDEEEFRLHQNVTLYLNRRYSLQVPSALEEGEFPFEMKNECIEEDLPESFKKTYETWLEREVLTKSIAWESLIMNPSMQHN